MKSFQSYIKEQEELAIVKVEEDKKQKLADFIRKIDDLNDEKFHTFAVDELGMSEDEAESLVYKMLNNQFFIWIKWYIRLNKFNLIKDANVEKVIKKDELITIEY